MAEAIASDLVGRLLGYLGQSVAGKFASFFGGRDKLKELEQVMLMIQARLSDAERLREGEEGDLVKLWLKRLKHVLYRLEDLFEEVSFADKEMEHMDGNKLTKAVCFPISKLSVFNMNRRVIYDVESILRELEGVTSDMHKLQLRVHSYEGQCSMNMMSRRETHSFNLEEEVVGRNEDKHKIVQMVLDSGNGGEHLTVIPIVGIGGLGKTTLAQLVYNDDDVQQHFELKCWVCVSETSSFEEVLRKVYRSVKSSDRGHQSLEQLQSCLREEVDDRRYLLVLDDVWDEDRERWLSLRHLLCGGKQGSKIIVTSRSKVVASNMGTVEPYELKGLSEEKSWELFRSLAFKEGQEERYPNLKSIGREIVKKCANVPLAVRTVAGILYSKDTEDEWIHFKDSDLRMMEQKDNSIMSTLKLSYDHLTPPLKQCFAYCAMFPKDHEYDTNQLIWLWMSQGFIEPLGRNQTLDDVGNLFFMELLRRCFFQDVKRNWYGRITHCKMHDLMHDLALTVGDECLLIDGTLDFINENVRHVYVVTSPDSQWKPPSCLLAAHQLRSLVLRSPGWLEMRSATSINKIISNLMLLRHLRALDLGEGCYKSLPNFIGKLKHLRYLRAHVHSLYLPVGITRLQKLQTLDLRNSEQLRELPRGFNNLSSLRHLNISCSSCTKNGNIYIERSSLVDMPRKFGQLTSLQTLDNFVVGKINGLDALANLNLAGGFQIFFRNCRQNMKREAMLANLKEKKLKHLTLNWSFLQVEEPDIDAIEVLECLQPPSTLKSFRVQEWKGVKFPTWGIDQIPCLLPNLVSVIVEGCERCEFLPSFSQLPNLKILDLRDLLVLEYIEIKTDNSNVVSSPPEAATCFPSLEMLIFINLPKLKGWSSVGYASDDASTSVTTTTWPVLNSLRTLNLSGLSSLEKLPRSFGCSTMLQRLSLNGFSNLESLPEWIEHLSQLQSLSLTGFLNLKSLPEWIQNLSQLCDVFVKDCPQLTALPESFGHDSSLLGDYGSSEEEIER